MRHDTYEKIIKWTDRAVSGLGYVITMGLASLGLGFIGLGLLDMILFRADYANPLLVCGSILLSLGSLALVRQLREHAIVLRKTRSEMRPEVIE